MGKTALAMNIASNICLKQNIPVLILSIEESKNSVINRIISKETKIDISKIKSNELNNLEKIKIQEKRTSIENSKIFIEDIGLQSIGKVIKLIRKYVDENELDIDIEVDGGINAETGKLCTDAGADVLVAGSYVFNAQDRKKAIESLK